MSSISLTEVGPGSLGISSDRFVGDFLMQLPRNSPSTPGLGDQHKNLSNLPLMGAFIQDICQIAAKRSLGQFVPIGCRQ